MTSSERLLFWDVDTQVDFMLPEGKLYVPGAEQLLPRLAALTEAARRHGIPVVASADDHRPDDAEISDEPDFKTTFPPHCMHGTPGAERVEETQREWTLDLGGERVPDEEIRERLAGAGPTATATRLRKGQLDVFSNPHTPAVIEAHTPDRVVLYGVATDFCNRKAVEGLLERGGLKLTVVTDAIQAIDQGAAEGLLDAWTSRGVELATTDEVLARL